LPIKHRVAGNCIIWSIALSFLDEAQMLPPEFLNPILTILKGLVENYDVSVMFSTATQPALTGRIGGKGSLHSRALVQIQYARLFKMLMN
jgi:hypothetical protein